MKALRVYSGSIKEYYGSIKAQPGEALPGAPSSGSVKGLPPSQGCAKGLFRHIPREALAGAPCYKH